jgi:hypothetical protein
VAGAALALWLVGIAVSVWQLAGARQVYQDIDAERRVAIRPFDLERMRDSQYVLEVLATPWRGCVPLPRPRFAFWNTNILDGVVGGDVLQAVLGIGLLVVLGSLFARCRPALLLFVVGSSGLLALAWLVYRGALRHHGHHLLVLIAALWMARMMERRRLVRDESASGPLGALPRRTALVGLLLVVNVAAGAYAVVRDWHDPFSAGREVAEFIRSEGLTGRPIVGQRDVMAAVVSGYLGQPVYCAALDREIPFLRWSLASRRQMSDSETLRRARSLAEETGREVLIIMRKHAGAQPHRFDGAIWAGRFARSIVPNERFELYLVPRPDPAAQSSGAAPHPGPVPRG